MTREIEFRAKSKYNNEFVYGDLIKIHTKNGSGYGIKTTPYHINDNCVNLIPDEIIPETVGQYTGLRDKNGVKVFEGDLIKIEETEFNIEGVHEVYYHIDGYVTSSVLFSNKDNANKDCLQYQISHKGAYVIGNKHDNPELLNMERNK